MSWSKINTRIRGSSFLPNYLCIKIVLSKYFVTHLTKICILIVINTYEYGPVIAEQLTC